MTIENMHKYCNIEFFVIYNFLYIVNMWFEKKNTCCNAPFSFAHIHIQGIWQMLFSKVTYKEYILKGTAIYHGT